MYATGIPSSTEKTQDSNKHYKPTWDSLDNRPLPDWYDESKFGIFIHIGVYSVPALGDWFWEHWKSGKYPTLTQYMTDNYKPNFTYQEFAHQFSAYLFNPKEWVDMFSKSGAKYVVLTSKHHEGYALWPTKYSFGWNSLDVGPGRNIVGELADAVRAHSNLRFGLYYSLYEWFNPLYLHDKKSNFKNDEFVRFKTIPQLHELVETYNPEVIWSDGEWETTDEYWKAKEFLAWLYNESPVKDTVVVNDRWGLNTLCEHGGFFTCQDRYNPKELQSRKWENAMTIDKGSWGYRKTASLDSYLTSKELIETLVTTVSCGGNLLLNVGPTSDGKIPPIYEERLLDIGKWLSINGEAIYGTQPWDVCRNDSDTQDLWYTKKQKTIYAIFFKWPENGKLLMHCLTYLRSSATIEFMDTNTELTWTLLNNTTEVILPDKALAATEWAWSLKIINSSKTKTKKPVNVYPETLHRRVKKFPEQESKRD